MEDEDYSSVTLKATAGTTDNNQLVGGIGDDRINGSYGNDLVTGGTVTDAIIFPDSRKSFFKTLETWFSACWRTLRARSLMSSCTASSLEAVLT
jgi:7-cyano-7-deazaguanine synthase in queuosine biosynthesis